VAAILRIVFIHASTHKLSHMLLRGANAWGERTNALVQCNNIRYGDESVFGIQFVP
jgi:hypothetical protein